MKRFSRLPLWKQLTIGLFLCLVCSVIIIISCLIIDMKEIGKNNWAHLKEMNEHWKMEIETVTANVDRLRYLHLIDNRIESCLKKEMDEKTIGEKLAEQTYMVSILKDIRGMNPYILRITILTADGEIYSNYVEDSLQQVKLAEEHILYSNIEYKNEMYLTNVYEGEINLIPYNIVTFFYNMYGLDSNEKLATIYVDLDFDAMKKRFLSFSQAEVIHFCANQKDIIYLSKQVKGIENLKIEELEKIWNDQRGIGRIKIGKHKFNIYVTKIQKLGWYLVQIIDTNVFLTKNMMGVYFLTIWIFIMFGLIFYIDVRIINHVNKPLQDFSKILNQVTLSEKQRPIYVKQKEYAPQEIREMIAGYNTLVKRIDENIILVYQAELNQKKVELQMLQYQINPHFLYNTLNVISALAKLNGIEQISMISESLSKIFHYNVKGGQLVRLEDELKSLQYYQQIQMIRFPDKFQVVYEIEERMEKCTVLKFLLQPLLENAIEHGVIPCKKKCIIKINGKVFPDRSAEITIFDDGIGISPDELQKLNEKIKNINVPYAEKDERGIGIMNVHMRIQNYYGKVYGIFVESKKGEYTCVHIRFPITEMPEKRDN